MNRSQHILGSGLVFAVGIWVTWVSYTQQPAEAFLFPRLIASVFVVLAGWTFGKAALGLSKVGSGISRTMFLNMVPGLAVMLVYVFWAAKALGFYTATAITFFILLSLYDPAPHAQGRTWVRRALITAGFVAVMYGLFAKLLSVYTPREILF
ncbi:tripartite tricarboxylate transporter TctB family protein [Leisingera sp. S132]|uniref:tripartite tricarboxylate transporter TctB family protein n=1 Tax=Leisingera sp. S132 TaxID=2867016 RepID=UPI0021A363AC|nr:tripartite tricarboxylate transporter TctB family protein [Leisingera sp. S132]UWQ78287.1 tripartite tricarboxylate transporter TctB family protein [Leisingera sp. S132]